MGETNIIHIQIPTCSSNYQISKDIYSFLHKQGNHIPISLNKNKTQSGGGNIFGNIFDKFIKPTTNANTTKESEQTPEQTKTTNPAKTDSDSESEIKTIEQSSPQINDESNIYLQFQNQTHTIDNIKGTKLYYLYLRNGECARWV